MSQSAPGRHRAPASDTRRFPWGAVIAIAGGVALAIAALIVFWPDPSPSRGGAQPTPSRTGAEPTTSPTKAPVIVESSRTVSVDGATVTIEEVSVLAEGAKVIAEPTQDTPLGLRLLGSSVVTPDGRLDTFDAPVTLTVGGSLTVRNRYRLTGCPDVLPAAWPSPAEFPGTTRSYLRLDGPLHTASALCPESPSRAKQLPGLTGALVEGDAVVVRLTWRGADDLTVRAVGSASTVAALVTDPRCDGPCIATVAGGGSELVQLQPVDPCPPATADDSLTLVVGPSGKRAAVVTVRVPGLHRAVCG